MDFTELLMTHGPYVAICLVITFMLTAAKRAFPKVTGSDVGKRILYFAPAIMGAAMGLFLDEPLKLQILYGMACGTVSQVVYGIVTKALASKSKLLRQAVAELDYRESVMGDDGG